LSYFELLRIFRVNGAVSGRGLKKVEDGERKALFGLR
jgi:hypothetical protein